MHVVLGDNVSKAAISLLVLVTMLYYSRRDRTSSARLGRARAGWRFRILPSNPIVDLASLNPLIISLYALVELIVLEFSTSALLCLAYTISST